MCFYLFIVVDDILVVLELILDDFGVFLFLIMMWIKYMVGVEVGRVSIDDNYYLYLLL